jgi:hypothetical protein
MKALFDPVRRALVRATPEECVRQMWLKWLIEEGGYPAALLAVEKELSALPHISSERLPRRRADIVAFASGTLTPLLLIECKAGALGEQALGQLTAYNSHIRARAVALVNASEALVALYEEGSYRLLSALPLFTDL